MIITTYFTESHRHLFEKRWLKTVPSESGTTIIATQGPQDCPTGEFGSDGFNAVMVRKMEHIAAVAKAHLGELILFADADVAFYERDLTPVVEKAMEGLDMAFQDDGGMFCAGLFAFRSTPETVRFLKRVAKETPGFGTDQDALNALIGEPEFEHLRAGCLPEGFWTAGREGHVVWEPGMEIPVPPEPLHAHHANWCVGVGNKDALLSGVWENYFC